MDDDGNGGEAMNLALRYVSRNRVNGKEKVEFQVDSEAATRDAFAIVHKKCGYKILSSGSFFPDYKLEDARGREVGAEAQYISSQFIKEHPGEKCDLIICWMDDWPDSPIPRLIVSDYVQERPDFEGFGKGEQLNINKVGRSRKQISRVLGGINSIALDVLRLLNLDRVGCYLGDCFRGSPSVECIRHGDRYYADVISSCWIQGWRRFESSVRLWIDFDAEMIQVRADLGQEVIGRFNDRGWGRILGRVSQNGYRVEGWSEEVGAPESAHKSRLTWLLKEIKDGKVSNIALTRSHRLGSVLFGDPYDVVESLHVLIVEMLGLIEAEELYVREEEG